ncbi:hypothetical protein [Bradyrhizobium yuanmingense]|nr:hypothetical protein [Bradyrhizobium yuanmingense]
MAFFKSIFHRPMTYNDLLNDMSKLIVSPPLPGDWKHLAAGLVGNSGVSLLDYWRTYFKSQLEMIAEEETWQMQRSRLLNLVMSECSWRAVYAVSTNTKHVASWSYMCEGAPWYASATESDLRSLLTQRWLMATLSDACLRTLGAMAYGVDKVKENELELHYSYHKEIKLLDANIVDAIKTAVDEYRDEDAHFIAAFKDDQLAPLIREQYTLLAQLGDDVANGTVDLTWLNSRMGALKQKQNELASAVSTS